MKPAAKGHPAPKGNTYGADAAAFKRMVRERMLRLRQGGVNTPMIIKTGNGNLTEGQVLDIIEAKKVPIAVYRVLDGILDLIETSPIADQKR
ncbi:MAG: hypothetical protein Q4E45_02370 [Eubacteriales bacterium]|nr:hypothetical protein [Eubacteriales bacterium]